MSGWVGCAAVLVNTDEIIIVEGMCARDYCSLETVRDGLVPQIEVSTETDWFVWFYISPIAAPLRLFVARNAHPAQDGEGGIIEHGCSLQVLLTDGRSRKVCAIDTSSHEME